MSGEALYERYKDALKRGHVASLRGRLEEALTAYAEAATVAPERATPHVSAGTALMRRKRPADAVRHYAVALSIAPRDETALLGRAQALAALGRRPEAADAFDVLAEVRAHSGKLADAVDAARRGLELAEGRDRRRVLERLIEQLRASEPGEPGRVALELALRVLEGVAVAPPGLEGPARSSVDALAAMEAQAAVARATGAPDVPLEIDERPEDVLVAEVADVEPEEPGVVLEATDDGVEEAAAQPSVLADAVEDAAAAVTVDGATSGGHAPVDDAWSAAGPAGEAGSPPVSVRAALDRDLPPDTTAATLTTAAAAALDAGDGTAAVERFLDLAAVQRAAGHIDAALDACYGALSMDPDNMGLHLALVQLYDDRGWGVLANEKLDLLARVASLDADDTAAARVAAARVARG